MEPCTSRVAVQSQLPDENEKEKIESFFGVYLLYTLNPKYKGRTYIGFTVNPERRIKQHNKGKEFGGACRTSNRGPWEMILIVHGFPNKISALRFEWAWQHPKRSRRLNHLPPKKAREKMFEYNFRLLGEMLNLGPWNRLPLTMRWLKPEVKYADFPEDKKPPSHMPVLRGPVSSVKIGKNAAGDLPAAASEALGSQKPLVGEDRKEEEEEGLVCALCIEVVPSEDGVQCLSDKCGSVAHLECLAERFRQESREPEHFLPIEGTCPVCDMKMLWGEIVRKRLGCTDRKSGRSNEFEEDDDDED